MHKLNEELVEKDRQCRHLINLLHSKNAEWKRIKTKMMQRRSVVEDTRPSGNTSGGYNEDTNTNGASEDNGSSADSSDDCTQLPANKLLNVDTETNPGSSQTSNYSNSIPVAAALAETQSNLDALICLISETESEPGTTENTLQVTCTAQNKLASATFNKVPSPSFKRNRKSHAGGCACCDKVRSPCSLNYVTINYFLSTTRLPDLQNMAAAMISWQLIRFSLHQRLHPVFGILPLHRGNKIQIQIAFKSHLIPPHSLYHVHTPVIKNYLLPRLQKIYRRFTTRNHPKLTTGPAPFPPAFTELFAFNSAF